MLLYTKTYNQQGLSDIMPRCGLNEFGNVARPHTEWPGPASDPATDSSPRYMGSR